MKLLNVLVMLVFAFVPPLLSGTLTDRLVGTSDMDYQRSFKEDKFNETRSSDLDRLATRF